MKQVKFSDVKISAKFRDTFYSGDWCIKVNDTLARPIEFSSPMCYSIAPTSIVEIDSSLEPLGNESALLVGGE